MSDRPDGTGFLGPLSFFPHKSVFITGATGFLGKVLLEKLLREVPNIKQIYILVRADPKKSTPPKTRLRDEILGSVLFNRLRQEYQNFDAFIASKIVVIEGDLDRDGFGLSESDVQLLLENVEVVIHAAAASDWQESLELALRRNVHATMQLLTLSKQMKNLKTFLHVSSAFITARAGGAHEVEERIYPLGFDVDDVVHELSHMKPSKMEKNASKLLRGFSNTHSFSKALIEILLITHKEHVPLAIVRPSILGCTYRDPFPGWVDSLSVAGTLFIYTGLGMVNFVPGNPENLVDIVPVDYAVNLILTAVSQLGSRPEQLANAEDVPIFHISSSHNPLKWGHAAHTMTQYWQKNPPKKAVGPCNVYMIKKYPLYKTQFLLKYQVPSKLYSALSRVLKSDFHVQQANKLKTMVQKCQKLNESLFQFVDNQWIFDTSNADRLRSNAEMSEIEQGFHVEESYLSREEQKDDESRGQTRPQTQAQHHGQSLVSSYSKFDFDFTTIDWHNFINYYCWGLLCFVLKESKIPSPNLRELRHGRLLSRDLDGRRSSKPWLDDFYFCFHNSKHVAYPSVRQQRELNSLVLSSTSVQTALKQVSQQKSIPEEVLQVKAKEILDRMATMQRKAYLQLLAWFFRKVWRNIYRQVDVNENALMKLFEHAKKGPVVLIPSHRSYIDFLITTYVLWAYDFPAPMIAAGEDFLNMSFVSNLLRFGGAFFLRRTFRGDTLYNSIFTEYVQRLLSMGFPIEFFVEGTRSRSGKLLQPKLGLVNMLTDTYFNKSVNEITFFPININYERVMEDSAYTREWMGEKKKAENLENLLKASSILGQDWGRISLKFCQPIVLSSFCERYTRYMRDVKSIMAGNVINTSEYNSSNKIQDGKPESTESQKLFDPYTNEEDRKELNIALAHQVVHDINEMTVWSPLAVVGSVILSQRHGIKRSTLLQTVDWIIKDLIMKREQGCEEWILEYSSDEIATKALKDFGNALTTKKNLITLTEQSSALLLAFYRNRLLHVFVKDSYVMSVYMALAGLKGESLNDLMEQASNGGVQLPVQNSSQSSNHSASSSSSSPNLTQYASSYSQVKFPSVKISQIVEEAEFLASVINKEFVYKVHPDEPERIFDTIREHLSCGWLERDPEDPSSVRLDSENLFVAYDAMIYFSSLISCFIDSYWTALFGIAAFKPTSIQRTAFGQRIHELADRLWQESKITTMESRSRETLNNAISAMSRLSILKSENYGEVISVSAQYSQNNSKLLLATLARLTKLRTSTIIDSISEKPNKHQFRNRQQGTETKQPSIQSPNTEDDDIEQSIRNLIATMPKPAKL